jgi:hypothetical protein
VTGGLSALQASSGLLDDVRSLLEHHPASKLTGPGRPASAPGVDPLLRSCVALCYTAWEVYVEEALRETVDHLLDHLDAGGLPEALRKWVASNGEANPWLFAGEGWKAEARARVSRRLDGDGGKYGFNTASPDGVIALYMQVLGYEPLTSVSWQRQSNTKVLAAIGDLVKVRGEIVHRGSTPGALDIAGVRNWISFVDRLCGKFDGFLVEFRSGMYARDRG